ncbi:MAG: tyrosine-type recombinase/integrase [Ignavibacteriales bacterium]|nr:tyrosine-type recombinase/integrase [Ignavibacteriales bacterium]
MNTTKAKQNSSIAEDFIFSHNQNIKFNEDFVSKQFKKAVRAAKLNDQIHLHTLRHSFASNLVQKGFSLCSKRITRSRRY